MRNIGVSNYDTGMLKEIIDMGGMVPQVNQVHMTPFLPQVTYQQTKILEF